MKDTKNSKVINFILKNPECSSKEIHDGISISISYATVKRILTNLTSENLISKIGKGKGTRYLISPTFELLRPIDIEDYFKDEIDVRNIKENFNLDLINETLGKANLFTENESQKLAELQNTFTNNFTQLSEFQYQKELERLAIDLSWKSSQIEGNTYSLLETERLLKDKQTAAGKTKEEAIMLLNHKDAIDFIIENPNGRAVWILDNKYLRRSWYCKYGDGRAKPTNLWTNIPLEFRTCFNGNKDCHHESAPRGSKTGTQGLKGNMERSIVPKQLCKEILVKMEELNTRKR
jgi:predicted transcriptional regulator